jgi:hypothetical protein
MDNYKIKILEYACFLCLPPTSYPHMQNKEQIIEYFFPKINYKFDESVNANVCITSNFMDNNNVLNNKDLNIFISVENLTNPKFTWYKHFNNYGEYNDEKIDIYIYSHISKIIKTDKYLAIPCIYSRINYYLSICNDYYLNDELNCTFDNKKFCLVINKSGLNNDILNKYVDKLKEVGEIDNIHMYDDLIKNKSCYNSIELLRVFNRYKFILCFENSKGDGYITEKIFNCFFARTIPIYWGADNINLFINKNSFINVENDGWIDNVKLLNENKIKYEECLKEHKISKEYDNENYDKEFVNFMEQKIMKKKYK